MNKKLNKEIKLTINKLHKLSTRSRGNVIKLTKKHKEKLTEIVAHFIRGGVIEDD